MEESVYVSGSNYFQEKYLKEMIALLDEGKTIQVGIACIGHTRNNTEQENYKRALIEHYGDKLEIKQSPGAYSYHYEYKLRKED